MFKFRLYIKNKKNIRNDKRNNKNIKNNRKNYVFMFHINIYK